MTIEIKKLVLGAVSSAGLAAAALVLPEAAAPIAGGSADRIVNAPWASGHDAILNNMGASSQHHCALPATRPVRDIKEIATITTVLIEVKC